MVFFSGKTLDGVDIYAFVFVSSCDEVNSISYLR